ncbi:peptide/nickel transport system ATP-binding protein [Modestobacter sp. DSM 44400]|uniref:dipeptide ABC transporter ATP-binding protein n=1 Tax=Modestobacter sp. DSM 44400 TaxID=1550230 RepID=UPI00089A4D76|nr:ABC transporter ATP-binding protein [Modestobacter sp. DSM 44400]SDY27543.1 peptide/nickel transport system ATP-binding protein [Modestobacter sp. DSM 44400]
MSTTAGMGVGTGHDVRKREVVLSIRDLQVEIHTRNGVVRPVDRVTLTVRAGETLGLVGESGSGKTMTGMSVLQLLPPGGTIVGGSITFAGRDLHGMSPAELRRLRGDDIAMVFQDPMTSLNPTRTIGSQLREAYRIHKRGVTTAQANTRAEEVLSLVRMPQPKDRLRDYPHQLSGGMRQRAMIAMALLCEPRLLIADEPTTALDVSIQAQILELLDDLKTRLGMAIILVTHDLGVIAGHADRVAVMYGGQIVEEAPTAILFTDPRHRYTQALFESMPTLELNTGHALASIAGMPPQLIDLPPMCRFAPRCRFADGTCRTEDPELVEVGPGHAHACFHPRSPGAADPTAEHAFTVLRDEDVTPRGGSGIPLVSLDAVEKLYRIKNPVLFKPHRTLHAVSGVSLDVLEGETLGIVGESGSGKTTVGRMLVGLEQPTNGVVRLGEDDISRLTRAEWRTRRSSLQMMFQDSSAALDPRMDVADLIAEPLAAQHMGNRAERREKVLELLDAVGLPRSAAGRRAHEFSGGQRQRIAMARALVLRPKVVVADEPVSALDVSIQAQILNLMRSLQVAYSLTYVVISHDLSLLKYLADRIGVMYLGKLVELGPSADVYAAPRHPYTAGLISSVPVPDPAREKNKQVVGLTGEIASALAPPSGCRFRTRCPLATDLCANEEPPLVLREGTHPVACHYPLTVGTPAGATASVAPARESPRT